MAKNLKKEKKNDNQKSDEEIYKKEKKNENQKSDEEIYKKEKNEKNEKNEQDENDDLKNEKNEQDENNDLKNESSSRPRGRPRKTINPPVTQQKQNLFDSDNEEKHPIPLHIPIYQDSSSDVSQDNEFTMKDESDEKKLKQHNNFLMCLTDDESDDEYNVKNLKKKLKKKDELIEKLKLEMTNRSDGFNDVCYSVSKKRSQNINLLKMKLLNKDNKICTGEKTKLACWWCTCNFDETPCFIPEKYIDGKYYVFGNFCSYNCVLSYIMKDDEYKVANRVSHVKKIYSELYETDEPLFPAPPKELLNKFGGPMTIEEYKNTLQQLELKNYKLKFDNIIQNPIHFEEEKKKL